MILTYKLAVIENIIGNTFITDLVALLQNIR